MLGTILLVVLILLLVGAIPSGHIARDGVTRRAVRWIDSDNRYYSLINRYL